MFTLNAATRVLMLVASVDFDAADPEGSLQDLIHNQPRLGARLAGGNFMVRSKVAKRGWERSKSPRGLAYSHSVPQKRASITPTVAGSSLADLYFVLQRPGTRRY